MKVSTDGVKLAFFACNSLVEELGEKAMLPRDALGVARGEMISLIGAGGKTTTMFRLAKEMRDQGCKVLVTTTTQILKPTKPMVRRKWQRPERSATNCKGWDSNGS